MYNCNPKTEEIQKNKRGGEGSGDNRMGQKRIKFEEIRTLDKKITFEEIGLIVSKPNERYQVVHIFKNH